MLFLGREVDLTDLGHPVHNLRRFRAKLFFDLIKRHVGVFHDVVKKPRHHGRDIQSEVDEDAGDLIRMHEERLTRKTHLSFVCFFRKSIRSFKENPVFLAVYVFHFFVQRFCASAFIIHSISPQSLRNTDFAAVPCAAAQRLMPVFYHFCQR
jgi:hypothetical protein